MAVPQNTKFETSFIPKKPVTTPNVPTGRKTKTGIMPVIGSIIFFVTLLLIAGVYGWAFQLKNSINAQLEELQQARAAFDESTIAAATRLNERIKAVEDLVNNHQAPSRLFASLENITLESVKFDTLTYTTEDDGRVIMEASGRAVGFESVVLQSDGFGATGDFRDVIFSEVQTDIESNGIRFSMNASIENSLVLYRKKFEESTDFSDIDSFDDPAYNASYKNIFSQ